MSDIRARYYAWLRELVQLPEWYSKLGECLQYTEFKTVMTNDINRASDARNLRNYFGYYNGVSYDLINACLGGYQPSVLEVMAALASRMETEYLSSSEEGDRTSAWFWDMLKSLGLDDQNNDNYNDKYVTSVLNDFMYRAYSSSGAGGLFTFQNPKLDIRTMDIWTQAMWKVSSYLHPNQ